MPTSLHPQAKFDPIPPDLDLYGLVDKTPNFKWVQRVSRTQIRNLGQQEFEKLVLIHVIAGGKPLVIDRWDGVLPKGLFDVRWLEETYDKQQENVRDINAGSDIPMTMGHYLRSMRQLANQWTPTNFRDERRQRLYLKDIDCPPEWHDALQKIIHPNLFYLNENASEAGGSQKKEDAFRDEAAAAPAGDLMSSLPEEMRAQNLMCYIGHEGTFTPAHREMCASLGQNIMVEASEDEKGEKPGSSIWFMTESKDREVVREYFLSMLGHDIEIEKHFAQINAWKKAPFDVYVVEQRVGDFILIPPLAAHQVWNRGTRTIKVAWNRTTAETLELALHEALPKARLVCRDEQYKNKAIIFFTLQKYYRQLQKLEEDAEMTSISFIGVGQDILRSSPRARQLAGDFKKLFCLFTEILIDEMFAHKEKEVEFIEFDSCITCSYCRSNIFNRFLTCKHCTRTLINGDEDTYDVCMECYAMGRSCACLSGLQWCEQWSWADLVSNYEDWRSMIIKNDGFVDFETSPQPVEIARQRSGKKSLAQICQEALRRRPWKDITQPEREITPSESEPEVDSEGKPKKKYKRKKKKGELRRCHVCCHKDYAYRVHQCTNPGCTESYCYGVLYRAFDMLPQKVLEDEQWQCPKCLGICNCGHCRRQGHTDPYTPKNTLLGHDTRPIADDRSVEALVDFRVHNLSWLKAAGEESRSKDSRRMKRLREQADNAKAQDIPEQDEADDSMQDAEHDPPSGMHVPGMNGYGDQSHVLGQGDQSMADTTMEGPYPPYHEENTGLADQSMAMDMSQAEDADTSLYPDPSLVAQQRIGMGYYEPDDTPDKILFDPFQAPSEEAIRPSKPDISEFVKKSIRAAKRKAKRENEDPDFVVGKSHHKKPRLAAEPEADFLDSMDPALFNGPPAAPEAAMDQPGQDTRDPSTAQDTGTDGPQNTPDETPAPGPAPAPAPAPAAAPVPSKKRGQLLFDANEPELRHAKPIASYVEADVDSDEFEEERTQATRPKTPAVGAQGEKKSAVDMAADAVRALFGTSSPAPQPSIGKDPESVLETKTPSKRRGRPPKNASASSQSTSASSSKKPTGGQRGWPKGRPRKSHLSQVLAADDSNEFANESIQNQGDDSDAEHERMIDELEAPLAAELRTAPSEAIAGPPQPRRRGRPRKSEVTTITVGSSAVDPSEEDARSTSGNLEDRASRSARRTRRSEGVDNGSTRDSVSPPPPKSGNGGTQLMSMAERMALKGKKFKIGKRKSTTASANVTAAQSGASTPAPTFKTPLTVMDEPTAEEPKEAARSLSQHSEYLGNRSPFQSSAHDESSRSPSPPPPVRRPPQPTVVRIGDTDSEADMSDSVSASGSDSGSDGDIPARRGAGRGGRGVGRGRGRGRGRPRGSGRGH
ncbi:AT hook domain-containing protein [Fusarium oxysporum f. sp. phaseoli]